MAKVDIKQIQTLRTQTGMGMMDCKKALEEAAGNMDEAIKLLRKKGVKIAAKRGDNATGAGLIHSYIHPGSTIGVLVELNCETDFVARNEAIKELADDLSVHIAAMNPLYLTPEDVDPNFLEKEKELMKEQVQEEGKTGDIAEKVLDGKIKKLYGDICLLQQKFFKDQTGKTTVDDALKELIGKVGENIKIRRFARYQIGG